METTPQAALPPIQGGERETLESTLDYFRALLRHKASGLTAEQLSTSLPPSTLTLGGLLQHLACVEQDWFIGDMTDGEFTEPWRSAPWDDDPDWEHTSAATTPPEEIFRRYDDAIEISRRITADIDDLSTLSIRIHPRLGEAWSLRFILVHMIEEYARHCGHADLIRQSIDGQTGDWPR